MSKAKAKGAEVVKIRSKVPGYNGESAGVQFRDGVGETGDPWLIQWFLDHGYTVEDPPVKAASAKAAPVEAEAEEKGDE